MTTPSNQDIPEQEYEVTPLELFFDLVFVFAVSQLSHHLLAHLSWRGAAETLVMLLAIFAVWMSTSWSATMIRADQSRTRSLILAVMLLGLLMNASVTRAFNISCWAFIIPFLLIQLGRAVWMIVNSTDAVFWDHYFRMFLLFMIPLSHPARYKLLSSARYAGIYWISCKLKLAMSIDRQVVASFASSARLTHQEI